MIRDYSKFKTAYNEGRDDMRDSLEAMELQAEYKKDKALAWKAYQYQMMYHTIPEEVDSSKYARRLKALEKDGIEASAMESRYSYTKPESLHRAPKNIFGDEPNSISFSIVSKEHWQERKESGKVGEQICPELEVPYVAFVKDSTGEVTNALNTIKSFYRQAKAERVQSGVFDKLSFSDGFTHIYEAKIANNTVWSIPICGYFTSTMFRENEADIIVFMDDYGLKDNHVDVINAYGRFIEAIKRAFKKNGIKVNITTCTDYQTIGNKQRAEYKPMMTLEERKKYLEEKEYMEQVEDEAKRRGVAKEYVLRERYERLIKEQEAAALAEEDCDEYDEEE